jgi:hypothetical protein
MTDKERKTTMNATRADQLCFHRYRLQVIQQWAESEYRRASLGAARAALMSEHALGTPAVNAEEPRLQKSQPRSI